MTRTTDEHDRIGRQRVVVLAIILAGYLLVLIDVSILMAALPSIRADLGFSDTSLSWAQNAYTLTFGGLLLLGARARWSPKARHAADADATCSGSGLRRGATRQRARLAAARTAATRSPRW